MHCNRPLSLLIKSTIACNCVKFVWVLLSSEQLKIYLGLVLLFGLPVYIMSDKWDGKNCLTDKGINEELLCF